MAYTGYNFGEVFVQALSNALRLKEERKQAQELADYRTAIISIQEREQRDKEEQARTKAEAVQSLINKSAQTLGKMSVGGERKVVPIVGQYPYEEKTEIFEPYNKEQYNTLLNELVGYAAQPDIDESFVKRGEDIYKEKYPDPTERLLKYGRLPGSPATGAYFGRSEEDITRIQPFPTYPERTEREDKDKLGDDLYSIYRAGGKMIAESQDTYSKLPSDATANSYRNTYEFVVDKIKKKIGETYPDVLKWYDKSFDEVYGKKGRNLTNKELDANLKKAEDEGYFNAAESLAARQFVKLLKTHLRRDLIIPRKTGLLPSYEVEGSITF